LNVAAAVANAVAQAIGAPINELPITPPRILAAMKADREQFQLTHLSKHTPLP
jgi:hypothetical protein